MGAWIEILFCCVVLLLPFVAPYMGAWIEIPLKYRLAVTATSLPTWERGLKYFYIEYWCTVLCVAPYMGAWIEISYPLAL